MKVLLIAPNYLKVYSYVSEEATMILPPLGLAYIASYLRENGVEVQVLDFAALRSNNELERNLIAKSNVDLVAMAATTNTIMEVYNLVKITKEVLPNAKIAVGGPHPTMEPTRTLKECSEIDFCVISEAEETMLELARVLESGKNEFDKILGISYRDNDEIKVNSARPLIHDLNKLPFPARDLLPLKKYWTPGVRRYPFATIMTCYDDKTEILTDSGWKFFNEITQNDKVATLNPKGNIISYETPKHFTKAYFEGDLLQFKSKHVDLLVTKNHYMYVNLGRNVNNNLQTNNNQLLETNNFTLIPAEQITDYYQIEFKKDGNWFGKEEEFFILPAVDDKPAKAIPIDLWLEFFGYWIAEGSANKKSNNRYIVKISQVDLAKKIKMAACLEKLGYNFYSNWEMFEISNKQLYTYLKQFGKHNEKYVPRELLQLSKRQLKILLDALVLGDGYYNSKYNQLQYITTSKKLADSVQEIFFKLGISGTIGIKKPVVGFIKGRAIKSQKTCYRVTANFSQNTPLLRKKTGRVIEEIPYKGYIYCCEVSSHIIYVRRNGRSVWCGNSRGCPYSCTFCSNFRTQGKQFRFRSPENVLAEIDELVNKYDVKEINIIDDNFTFMPQRVKEICDLLIKRKYDLILKTGNGIRSDRVNLPMLKHMRKAGFYLVAFGIESGNPEILKKMRKGETKEHLRNSVKWARQAGLITEGFFMFGNEGEGRKEMLDTIEFAKELDLNIAQFQVYTPVPGSPYYEKIAKEGKVFSTKWEDFNAFNEPLFEYGGSKYDLMIEMQRRAYREYYFRPKMILKKLLEVRNLKQLHAFAKAGMAVAKFSVGKAT